MCNITYPKFHCRICQKIYLTKIKLFSVTSELWVHIKYNNLNYLDYRYLQNSNESWYCIECFSTIFPFNSLLSNKKFLSFCTKTDNNNTNWIDLENDHNSSLSLKLSTNRELLLNQFNNATLKIVTTQKKFFHPNITTLRKCTTLKYFTKINRSPCLILMYVLLIKIFMTFNISWIALTKIWYNSKKWNKNHKKSIFIK